MYFFEILENIMNERKLKISDISKMTGIPDSTLRSIINRKNKTVALDVAFKISKGLDIPIEALNGEEISISQIVSKENLDNIEIGKRIKSERENLNLTLKDIAQDIGVAISTIQRYENGLIKEIKLPVIQAIANSLNVNPNWLIGKEINKHSDNNKNNTQEKELLLKFNKLNQLGKEKAIERIEELTQIPKYQISLENTESNNIKTLPIKEVNKQNDELVKIVARGEGVTYITKEEFEQIKNSAIKVDNIDDYF